MRGLDIRSLEGSREATVAVNGGYFPVVLRTGPFEAVAAIRGGAPHIGIEGRLDMIRTSDCGKTWSEPVVVADSEWDDRNPSLGLARDGTVVLAYHHQGNYDERGNLVRGERVATLVKISEDGGKTWSDPFGIGLRELEGRSPYGRMINVGSTLLMPIYGAPMGKTPFGEESFSFVIRSKDSGHTWGDPSVVGRGMNETSFVTLPSGEILAIMRSESPRASLYSARSRDGGYTWTEPVRVTQDSEHPGDVLLLSNGWLLLVYGHRHPPFGVQGLISRDEGKTWEKDLELIFARDLPGGDCGYPSATMFAGGRVLVMYYLAGSHTDSRGLGGALARVVTFDEEALVSRLRQLGLDD